jgi:hypothetical protein
MGGGVFEQTFRMENGLIKEYREITNPLGLYKAFGYDIDDFPHAITPFERVKDSSKNIG